MRGRSRTTPSSPARGLSSQSATLDQLKSQAASTNGQDVQLRALERDAKSQRDLLESYLAKYREATSHDTINSTPADARIVSRATVSNIPAYPKKLPTILIATFAMLVMSSGLVITKEILERPAASCRCAGNRLWSRRRRCPRRDSTRSSGRGGASRAVSPRSRSATSMRTLPMICTAMGVRRIGVFGAAPGMSISQTAIKLARALAEESRVVLVGLGSGETAIRADFQRAVGRRSCRTRPRHRVVPRHHHQGQAVAAAPDLAGPRADRPARHSLRAAAWSRALTPWRTATIMSSSMPARSRAPEIDRIAEIAPHAVLVAETRGARRPRRANGS